MEYVLSLVFPDDGGRAFLRLNRRIGGKIDADLGEKPGPAAMLAVIKTETSAKMIAHRVGFLLLSEEFCSMRSNSDLTRLEEEIYLVAYEHLDVRVVRQIPIDRLLRLEIVDEKVQS